MIPKTIHYCWFGPKPKPELVQKCIKSWKEHCPEYQFIEWNEYNFDIASNEYVKETYKANRYAFVTDYVRLYALYTYGGIYFDTDVEVLKKIDSFLHFEAFSGFESTNRVGTAIMAGCQGFPFFGELMRHYNTRHFFNQEGKPDLTTNVQTITDFLTGKGLIKNNQFQEVCGFSIFPSEFFYPKDFESGKLTISDNTYTIHHYDGSWKTEEEKKIIAEYQKYTACWGEHNGELIFQFVQTVKADGIISALKKVAKHLI